jgi:tRNA-dihydrouridine synthase A
MPMTTQDLLQHSPWRLCVAPMMDWTDRHCRAFHRLVSPHARLYTEMVTTGALIHGNQARHLDFSASEHPVALQLGGSEPADLATCAKLGEQWGYDEINLNCGCPSERVQRGAFGACLMAEPALVRDCVKAMADAVHIPITVKHRIGIDQTEDYNFVRDFVGTVSEGGCRVFIVHARNAWLKGLSPKENREVPPLRYHMVERLAQDFPQLTFVINGGIKTVGQARGLLNTANGVQGVMIGREAYHNPWVLREMDNSLYEAGWDSSLVGRMQVWRAVLQYVMQQRQAAGVHPSATLRHVLGLFNGLSGARRWRQVLSNPKVLGALNDAQLLALELPRVANRELLEREEAVE